MRHCRDTETSMDELAALAAEVDPVKAGILRALIEDDMDHVAGMMGSARMRLAGSKCPIVMALAKSITAYLVPSGGPNGAPGSG